MPIPRAARAGAGAALRALLTAALLSAPPEARAQTPPQARDPGPGQPAEGLSLPGPLRDSLTLPNPFTTVIEIEGREGLAATTESRRLVFRGQIFDMATGEVLRTVGALRAALRDHAPERFGLRRADLRPFTFGTGPAEVILIVDPICPFCAELFAQLRATPAYGQLYRFTIHTVPFLGTASLAAVEALDCAPDRAAALEALLQSDRRWLQQNAPAPGTCDATPIIARTLYSQKLGAAGTPFLIAPSGQVSLGLPEDLFGFLLDG